MAAEPNDEMWVKPDDERLKGLAEFYDKYTQEQVDLIKPHFNKFVEKVDFASLLALNMCLEDVKRSLYVRDTLKVHTQPLKIPPDWQSKKE
jgi:hypothetical protein